jgi:3-dehydroquinate synthase
MKISMQHYDIMIGKDSIDDLENHIKAIYHANDIFIVTDDHVFDLYHEKIESILKSYKVHFVSIKPGEKSKSYEVYLDTIKKLIAKGMKRNHLLIALGGGVVGDLAGFIAATLFRGISFIQIPTTLLAQVDSSIGGKVGIDIEEGKNLIGAFYTPRFVLIDPNFLKTLDHREYLQGVAEMIKAGLIKDKTLFEYFKTNDQVTEKEILMALDVKRDIVLKDPYEKNERMLLNFGHTYGHAIERKFNYETYKHGEAISYGMLLAIEEGIRQKITPPHVYDEVKQVLFNIGLVKEPLFKKETLDPYILTDKKNTSNKFHFVCLKDIGESVITKL